MGRKGNRGANKGKVNINLEQHSKHSSEDDQLVRQGENLFTMDEELKQLEEAKLLSYQSYTQRGIPSYSQPSYNGPLKANLFTGFYDDEDDEYYEEGYDQGEIEEELKEEVK
jgi:hypothetical protein